MFSLNETINILAKSRPIFHSEADFQHALAWEIQRLNPTNKIRLERPFSENERNYLDLFVINREKMIAVELKYKTRGLRVETNDETYNLLDQSAQDLGRYDVLKDVQRIERYVETNENCNGYVIFLTNDSAYWKKPNITNTIDASFRVHDGATIHGTLSWSSTASKGTMKDREESIVIKGKYVTNWIIYSEPSKRSYGLFRYLIFQISRTYW